MKRADGQPTFIDASGSPHVLQAAVELNRGTAYKERFLQDLIFEHPECLPVGEIEPVFGPPVSVCTELPIEKNYIDNLFMTADGDLVVAETKLWRNGEARREVVAQALEYAGCLFKLDYDGLQAAVLKAKFGQRTVPNRLYDLFTGPDVKDEPEFVDAVNMNLRRGRALILVVGDGIRSEAAQLGALVQSHAGAHFTFAMVELRVFEMPDGGFLSLPRTLAQTEMITRGIVQIDDQRARVVAGAAPVITKRAPSPLPKTFPESITAETFFEDLAKIDPATPGKLKMFLAQISPLGVTPDFRRTLVLRWDTPDGKSLNLGYIDRDGRIWTDAIGGWVPAALRDRYVREVAVALGVEAKADSAGIAKSLKAGEHAPRLTVVGDRLNLWAPAIEKLLDELKHRSE